MNYMKQVAETLGVEMGERFKIKGHTNNAEYYISEQGLMREGFIEPFQKPLTTLLTGEAEIVKKPWKPKCGDTFYYVSISGTTVETRYTAPMNDVMFLYMGNCFRTEEDAKAHRDEIMAKFKAVME